MSHEYAMSRVRDALEKCEGNHLKAQRMVMGWLEKDHSLLFGLVAPWMQSIISHAVNHIDQPEKKKLPKRIELDDSVCEFGAALAQELKGGTSFGQQSPRNVGKPGKASQTHIDAINKLAGAGKGAAKGKKDK